MRISLSEIALKSNDRMAHPINRLLQIFPNLAWELASNPEPIGEPCDLRPRLYSLYEVEKVNAQTYN